MGTNANHGMTTQQAVIAIATSILGVGVLTLPRSVTEKTGTPDGWISVTLYGFAAILISFLLTKLILRFPKQTVYEYSQEICGKWIGRCVGLFFIGYYIIFAGFEIRGMAEVTKLYLLNHTPIEVTIISFIFVGIYLVTGGFPPIIRLFELLLPITVLIFFMVLAMSLKVFELDYVRPVMGLGIWPVIKGMQGSILTFVGFESILILSAFMKDPRQTFKASVIGIAIPTFFYILITIITVGTLGIDNVITSPWPTLDVLRSFEITGIFFERFESFLLAVWIMQIFTTFVGTTYFAALGLSQLTQRKITPFIYGISPLVYISAMIPQNINEFFTMGQWLEFIQMFTIAIIAPLLWIVSVLRGKKA